MALSRLKITPDVYYDLTSAETMAMLEGEADRELLQLKQTRMLGTLLRNAHFQGVVTEAQFMPLPGDAAAAHNQVQQRIQQQDPAATFYMLAEAFGGTITVEANA